MQIAQNIILCFIFCSVFTNAFAVSSFVNIPTFISLILCVVFFCHVKWHKIILKPSLLYIIWAILTFSLFLFSEANKALNHWVMWTWSFFIFYFVVKKTLLYVISLSSVFFYKIFNVLSFTVFFASVFAIFEFFAVNFSGIDLNLYIPRGSVEEYQPLALTFIRARSFMEESGQFSFFLECFAPISIGWIFINSKKKKVVRIIYVSVVVISLFVTFSAYGFVALLMSLIVFFYYFIVYSESAAVFFKKTFFILISIVLASLFLSTFIDQALEVVNIKLDGSTSMNERTSRFEGILPYLKGVNLFIGYGPAAHETLGIGSFISSYLVVLMSTGILGLILFVTFLINHFSVILSIEDYRWRCCFVISFVTSVVHLMFVDMIIYPWFWLLLSLLYCVKYNKNVED
ncbi:hypothetical protein [Bacteroides sp. 224]|uniref:hypothetical protein n=1 Tax=Bacteroides sp. 224 TaxID=2302936 RepID=UPI0013D34590|nr:hypothetical protein [Bacteroides sp. 224]NDV64969.1 hypothetical protein [Bacteroides sp. 224]